MNLHSLMLELIESLSLVSGAFIIVGVSIALAFVWARITNVVARWVAAFGAPFLLSYCLYWSPVWLGASRTEYSAWAGVVIVSWFLFGGSASAIITYIVKRHNHARGKHAGV